MGKSYPYMTRGDLVRLVGKTMVDNPTISAALEKRNAAP